MRRPIPGHRTASPAPRRAQADHGARWWRLTALVLLPLLVAGVLVGTVWGRADRLHRVHAAIVNSDEAVKVNGQVVPLGRQLAAELVTRQSTNISWTLSDPADAASGLADGRYAAVVTIPRNFSAAATSVSSADKARQATIDVQTSPSSPVQDAEIARQVASLATQGTSRTITSNYLGNLYVGFNSMGKNLTSMANGATQLSNGASQLSRGATSASTGAGKLAAGLDALDANGSALASGAAKLGSGGTRLKAAASSLADGVQRYTSGAGQVADGVRTLSSGVSQYTAGTAAVVGGVQSLSTGVSQYTAGAAKVVDGIGQLNTGVQKLDRSLQASATGLPTDRLTQLATGAQQVAAGASGLADGLAAYEKGLRARAGAVAGVDPTTAATTAVTACVTSLAARGVLPLVSQQACTAAVTSGTQIGVAGALAGLTTRDPATGRTLLDGASSLATGARQVASGVGTLATELPKAVAAQTAQLRAGVRQLATGSQALATQSAQLRTAGTKLAAGASTLASRSGQLTSAGTKLAAGASTLATSSARLRTSGTQLSAGAKALSAGVADYADGAGQLGTGVARYTAGVHSARQGADQLTSGLSGLGTGTQKLAGGMKTFADKVSKGATQVPSYSQQQRETLSSVVSQPIDGGQDPVTSPLRPVTSLLLVLGAWFGALATWLVLRPLTRRALVSSRPSWQLAGRTALMGAAVAAGQGILLGLLGCLALRPGVGRGVALVAFLVLVSVAFTAVNQALAAWLGPVGRGIAVVLATVTAAVGLVSAVPGVFGSIHGASPLAPALTGVRKIVAHAPMGAGPVSVLLALAVAGWLLSLLAVARHRQLSASGFRRRAAAGRPLLD